MQKKIMLHVKTTLRYHVKVIIIMYVLCQSMNIFWNLFSLFLNYHFFHMIFICVQMCQMHFAWFKKGNLTLLSLVDICKEVSFLINDQLHFSSCKTQLEATAKATPWSRGSSKLQNLSDLGDVGARSTTLSESRHRNLWSLQITITLTAWGCLVDFFKSRVKKLQGFGPTALDLGSQQRPITSQPRQSLKDSRDGLWPDPSILLTHSK